jgi:hypothetical protein
MRDAVFLVAMLLAPSVWADTPDISARRLLSGWKDQDPSMHMLAEVIASAFASGLSWSAALWGKQVYCPPADLKGQQVMAALERFIEDNPDMAGKPNGDAMAASLSRAFPCQAL